jgi:hypothetical protein
MKTIVTHFSPDTDACTSVWLLKRFLSGWESADTKFVAAGTTLNNEMVDTDPNILHVDTGCGMLDHHQTDEDTCAAKRTFEYIRNILNENNNGERKASKIHHFNEQALERLTDVVNEIDHFREAHYPNPSADFYDFGIVAILDGWKILYKDEDQKILDLSFFVLDGIYKKLMDKIWAEKEIKEQGIPFTTKWGDAIGIETLNDEVVRLAQKQGFILAVRKDPKKGYVRIKALPDSNADLTGACEQYKKLDPNATWYLHPSKRMLLNGSIKNPESKPSVLTLREIVDVLKK